MAGAGAWPCPRLQGCPSEASSWGPARGPRRARGPLAVGFGACAASLAAAAASQGPPTSASRAADALRVACAPAASNSSSSSNSTSGGSHSKWRCRPKATHCALRAHSQLLTAAAAEAATAPNGAAGGKPEAQALSVPAGASVLSSNCTEGLCSVYMFLFFPGAHSN